MPTFDLKKRLGAVVRQSRLRLGMSQEVLAHRSELHATHIEDIEQGSHTLSLHSISKLAQALGVSVGAFFQSLVAPTSSHSQKTEADSAAGVDILIIDDDATDIAVTFNALAGVDFLDRIDVVPDAHAALDYMLCRGEHTCRQTPRALILLLELDIPKVSGMHLLRFLKADHRTKNAHVLVFTRSRNEEHMREALHVGADAYFLKPLEHEDFGAFKLQFEFYWTLLKRAPALV